MKIEEFVSGKNGQDTVSIDGTPIPIKSLNTLPDKSYVQVRPCTENRLFSFWGKVCTACFTEAEFADQS